MGLAELNNKSLNNKIYHILSSYFKQSLYNLSTLLWESNDHLLAEDEDEPGVEQSLDEQFRLLAENTKFSQKEITDWYR